MPGGLIADSISVVDAIVLGVVEGLTEYLPVSSTGHLVVVQRLLGIGTTEAGKPAADAYAVIIQLGAILAVVAVSWERIRSMFQGLLGRDASGRRILIGLAVAFVPAALIGLLVGDSIKENLLEPIPIAAAWIVGGIAIMLVASRYESAQSAGRALEELTVKHGVLVGLMQSLALWPGVSRSLVTILAGVLLGYTLLAAVEFSFLLGLATLGAATIYESVDSGRIVTDTYGLLTPTIGVVVSFAAAVVAIRWMLDYLRNNSLSVFGNYRIGAGIVTLVLVAANVI